MTRRPKLLFLGSEYAGHKTRFMNLRAQVSRRDDLDATFHSVTGWKPGGFIERATILPQGIRGRLRAGYEASAIARVPRPDAIWTSGREELAPFAFAQVGPLKRPLVLDLDATDTQLESMAIDYFGRHPKTGLQKRVARHIEGLVLRQATAFTPWSNWAADGLVQAGVDPERITVSPPGIDLTQWAPMRRDTNERPLRLLFVGGDFRRKGGDLLLEAIRTANLGVEATIVTNDETGPLPPGATLLRAGPNSAELRAAFAWADIFVMPTRADCFGIATIEAMATGLPVIVGDVGGARDIVEEGVTGWLIEANENALSVALRRAVEERDALPAMGARGRRRAEERFDARRNDAAVIDLVVALANEGRSNRQG